MKCAGCTVTIPDDEVYLRRTTVVDGLVFHTRECAANWALADIERLRGGVRYIARHSGGLAKGLAEQMLYGNAPLSHSLSARDPRNTRKSA